MTREMLVHMAKGLVYGTKVFTALFVIGSIYDLITGSVFSAIVGVVLLPLMWAYCDSEVNDIVDMVKDYDEE